MKINTLQLLVVAFGLASPPTAVLAQPTGDYSMNWSRIAGGGGTSRGSTYSVTGTVGQPDAGTMSGGNFTLQGGFWGLVAAVQTPGAPYLSVARSNSAVIVSWPLPDTGWRLYATANLAGTPVTWTEIPPPYQTNSTGAWVTLPAPSGIRFFRLQKP